MSKIKISPYLFRSIDIRGAEEGYVKSQEIKPGSLREKSAHGNVLSPEIAEVIGRAVAVEFKPKKVVVGYDARLSSPALLASITKGLTEQGVDVDLIGLVSSDCVYFAIGYYKYEMGIMITGSHTRKEINGFKISQLIGDRIDPVGEGAKMEELRDRAITQDFPKSEKIGETKEIDVNNDYTKYILSFFPNHQQFTKQKIVLDAGNGVGGAIYRQILNQLPIETINLNFQPDGHFPNHEPDPMIPENMADLIAKIKQEKADFGVAWDGDADRVSFITPEGEILTGSTIGPLLLPWVANRHPKSKAIITPPMSRAFHDLACELSIEPVYAKVGTSFVKMAMNEHNSPFAAEEADHFMFAETFNNDSGILPLLIILDEITRSNKTFSTLLKEVKRGYCVTGEINTEVNNAQQVMDEIEKVYIKEGAEIKKIDGLMVSFTDWFFVVRPSLNDPVLRLNLEARSEEKRDKEADKVLKLIKEFDK